ncbi:Uncharacterised protein [Mycobacteroides abscessus subsp. abscessus]|nr:Uncharacterised protein [Mycobacteroides abscessus subsp. abscessus]
MSEVQPTRKPSPGVIVSRVYVYADPAVGKIRTIFP